MDRFEPRAFLSRRVLDRITDLRVEHPEAVLEIASGRGRRPALPPDGRLCLLAADHPARGVTAVGEDPLLMADRQDYLARIVRVLASVVDERLTSLHELLKLRTLLHPHAVRRRARLRFLARLATRTSGVPGPYPVRFADQRFANHALLRRRGRRPWRAM